ncbi:MAG: FAD-binding oxidoreductase [Gemmataceae bacterium]|nr:FAD-binding oxidoreductase [Gemmataceae bacterium]
MARDKALSERIHDDLKGILKGEVRVDLLTLLLFSTDGSPFELMPLAVVNPLDANDLSTLVKYASENKIALTPRGAGTGTAGGALGQGIIVDLSRNFRKIHEPASSAIRVEAGATLRELKAFLGQRQARVLSEPWNEERTVGGWLASDAVGPTLMEDGHPRHHVEALQAVLNDGTVAWLGNPAYFPEGVSQEPSSRLEALQEGMETLLGENQAALKALCGKTPFPRGNYNLQEIARDPESLAKIFLGAEGSLGILVEAVLRIQGKKPNETWALYCFNQFNNCLLAGQAALSFSPHACEILDHRMLSMARSSDNLCAEWIHPATQGALLVGFRDQGLGNKGKELEFTLGEKGLAPLRTYVTQGGDLPSPWRIREFALKGVARVKGPEYFLPLLEDLALPPSSIPQFLEKATSILQSHEATAVQSIRPGTGQVQMRVLGSPWKREEAGRLWSLADQINSLVIQLDGSLSCQEGLGLARIPWQAKITGPGFSLLKKVKDLFDPLNVFNPGKVVGPSPEIPVWPFRTHPGLENPENASGEPGDGPRLNLEWLGRQAGAAAAQCNGCGLCRTNSPGKRMCPVFHVRGEEQATPRAKANLFRLLPGLKEEGLDLSSPETRRIADLCFNCKMCGLECPAGAQIPALMLEAKAANVEKHGLERNDWVLARMELLSQVGSALAPLANWFLGHSLTRWLLEKFLGISRHRSLAKFSRVNFLHRARQKGWTIPPRPGRPRVAYFLDPFANYNEPEIAEAVVGVLHHNHVEVLIPPGQTGSGMTPLALGDVETARENLKTNLRVFADLAREGYPILFSEPAAALFFTQDASRLSTDPDVKIIAEKSVEFCSFLWDMHQQGNLRTDFKEMALRAGHHIPCHVKALGQGVHGPNLLGLIPKLELEVIDRSCSGMAGTFGLKKENFELSRKIGRPMLERLGQPDLQLGSTECSWCKMQMEDGTKKRTFHPAQILSHAYGLSNHLEKKMQIPVGRMLL